MTTYFVDSAAAGANNGTSWTDAYTTLATAIGSKVMGDIFLIDYRHSETLAGTLAFTDTTNLGARRGVRITSVDKDTTPTNTYRTGAKIIPFAQNYGVNGVHQGLHFDNSTHSANGITFAFQIAHSEFDDCTFTKGAAVSLIASTATSGRVILKNCTFNLATSYTRWISTRSCHIEIVNPVFSGTKGSASIAIAVTGTSGYQGLRIIGADLSAWDNLIDSATATGCNDIELRRCRLPTSFSYESGQTYVDQVGATLRLVGCTSGNALSSPVYNVDFQQHEGYCKTVSDRYRTSGATDGTTPYGFELLAAADRSWKQTHRGSRTVELGAWVTTGAARTVTVYLAHNGVGAGTAGALQNNVCWAELEGPWVGASPTAQGYAASSMCALDAAAADLTTDGTSTWTGSSIGTHQKIDFVFTPAISGQVIVRVFLAPESGSDVTIYVDPELGVA